MHILQPERPMHLTVSAADDGRPLADIVAAALGSDADGAQRLIARGGLWVGGARLRDAAALAQAGLAISIQPPPGGIYRDVVIVASWIVFEDDDLLALDKPAGVYVDEAPWDAEGNLHVALARFLRERDGDQAPMRLHAAHRLDRDTTGVLLFSKNPAMNPALQRAFAGGLAHKTYLGLCAGVPAEDEFELETGHGRERHGRFRVYPRAEVGRELPGGSRVKLMRTSLVVLRRLDDAALLHAFPETGRTHQIRLHLASIGHPLIGDAKYGGPANWAEQSFDYHLLHAARLELPHPRSGAPLAISAALPSWARVE